MSLLLSKPTRLLRSPNPHTVGGTDCAGDGSTGEARDPRSMRRENGKGEGKELGNVGEKERVPKRKRTAILPLGGTRAMPWKRVSERRIENVKGKPFGFRPKRGPFLSPMEPRRTTRSVPRETIDHFGLRIDTSNTNMALRAAIASAAAKRSHGVIRRFLSAKAKTKNQTHVEKTATEAPKSKGNANAMVAGGLLASCLGLYYYSKAAVHVEQEDMQVLSNWSGTHRVKTDRMFEPENEDELLKILQEAHERGRKLRPAGNGLSPNALSFCTDGMVRMTMMDKVLQVDKKKKQVTVQAGITVQTLLDELNKYGLTLENLASIREQQVGGWIQAGCHGTGATLPPVEDQIVSMKLATPAKGVIEVSASKDPELFSLAKCGLGSLGIVTEVTIQAVPAHKLVEKTITATPSEVEENHTKWLKENRHLRYMWIPYTDTVVVVTCNPVGWFQTKEYQKFDEDEKLAPARQLLIECKPELTQAEVEPLSFTELRDHLLAIDPLNTEHVIKVNQVEAEYWKKSEGVRVDWSDKILGFDCGGAQWVSEVALPTGKLTSPDMSDVQYVKEVYNIIEANHIPAPAPIEQRWTARSTAQMSPAYSSNAEDIFSWVGIIMYLPSEDPAQREAITKRFFQYFRMTDVVRKRFNAQEHWAKIEMPTTIGETVQAQEQLRARYPVELFNAKRNELDPGHILSNHLIETLFKPTA